eukprot:m.53172 g.53172  ORF g.53172 m.53172 type:complete len:67 (+) comp12768_c0_seq1:192-392(+)
MQPNKLSQANNQRNKQTKEIYTWTIRQTTTTWTAASGKLYLPYFAAQSVRRLTLLALMAGLIRGAR